MSKTFKSADQILNYLYNESYQEDITTIRSAAILTNSYVAGAVLEDVEHYNQLILYVDFTLGSLTNGKIKIEFSDDNSDYYQETYSSVSAGVSTETVGDHTFAATGKYTLSIPIKAKYIKVSALGTGTVTSSSMAISAIVGVA